MRIHRGERLYKCQYCNKEYYDASYYKKHLRLHTGEKPYMCTVCGKQFHRSDYLKLHSYSHTDERPYKCELCGRGFKMNYNLKIHLKNHENQDLQNGGFTNSNASNSSCSNEENTSFGDANNIYSNNQCLNLNSNEIVSFLIEDIDLEMRENTSNSTNSTSSISNQGIKSSSLKIHPILNADNFQNQTVQLSQTKEIGMANNFIGLDLLTSESANHAASSN